MGHLRKDKAVSILKLSLEKYLKEEKNKRKKKRKECKRVFSSKVERHYYNREKKHNDKEYKLSFTWKMERPENIRNTRGLSPGRWKDLMIKSQNHTT